MSDIKQQVIDWFIHNAAPLTYTVLVFVVYFFVNSVIARVIRRAEHNKARQGAAHKVNRTLRLVTGFFAVLTIMVIWGIKLATVTIFASTTITLLGVALFASWSLLSNVTAYFVLLFHPSFTRGRFVRVLDADNYVEGHIADLRLFSLELLTSDGAIINYPNNAILGRVVIVDPPDRLHGVGKIVNPRSSTEDSEEAHRTPSID